MRIREGSGKARTPRKRRELLLVTYANLSLKKVIAGGCQVDIMKLNHKWQGSCREQTKANALNPAQQFSLRKGLLAQRHPENGNGETALGDKI